MFVILMMLFSMFSGQRSVCPPEDTTARQLPNHPHPSRPLPPRSPTGDHSK